MRNKEMLLQMLITHFWEVESLFMLLPATKGNKDGTYRTRGPRELKNRINDLKTQIVEYYIFTINERLAKIHEVLEKQVLENAKALKKLDKTVLLAYAEAVYRVRPGTGNSLLPLEWGLTLHPTLKVPYIPGSSVKGALRAAFMSFLVERLNVTFCDEVIKENCIEPESEEANEVLRTLEKVVSVIFGNINKRGVEDPLTGISAVTTLDVYPIAPGIGGKFVVGDILTPHYPTTKELRDELDVEPIPIQGVSLAEKSKYLFVIAIDDKLLKDRYEIWEGRLKEELKEVLNVTDEQLERIDVFMKKLSQNPEVAIGALLLKAFSELGIGGKTTRGYGRFAVKRMEVL